MKRINKVLPIIITTILIFAPYYVSAVEPSPSSTPDPAEPSPSPETTPSPSPEVSPSSPPSEGETQKEYTITLDNSTLELDAGASATLKATVTPDDENIQIEWSSSDPEIVSVDQNGNITAGNTARQGTQITATIKGTDKSATCTVNVSRKLGTEAVLRKLEISNGTLDKNFDPNILKYTVTVASNVSELKMKYDVSHSYKITGNSELKNGSVVKIIVTSEDEKTTKTYELTIKKEEAEKSLELKSLKINGYALNETFSSSNLKYTATIPYEIETITVEAVAKDETAKISISGDTNLKVGQNTVTITVSDNKNSKKYQIIVTREKESKIDENPTSIITSTNHNKTSSGAVIGKTNNNDDDSFLKYVIISLACLILFAIGGIGIYFYLKTSPKKLKKELKMLKKEEIESPIIEVPTENQNETISNPDLSFFEEEKKEEEFSQDFPNFEVAEETTEPIPDLPYFETKEEIDEEIDEDIEPTKQFDLEEEDKETEEEVTRQFKALFDDSEDVL